METPAPQRWLTACEAARSLGIPEDTFVDLVEVGIIPAGAPLNRRVVRWPALTIFAVGVLLSHLMQLAKGKAKG
jgi:hypothetical protein